MEMGDKGNYISNEKATSQQSNYVENALFPIPGKFF